MSEAGPGAGVHAKLGMARRGVKGAPGAVQWPCPRRRDRSKSDVAKWPFLHVGDQRIEQREIPMNAAHDRRVRAQASDRSIGALRELLDLGDLVSQTARLRA